MHDHVGGDHFAKAEHRLLHGQRVVEADQRLRRQQFVTQRLHPLRLGFHRSIAEAVRQPLEKAPALRGQQFDQLILAAVARGKRVHLVRKQQEGLVVGAARLKRQPDDKRSALEIPKHVRGVLERDRFDPEGKLSLVQAGQPQSLIRCKLADLLEGLR